MNNDLNVRIEQERGAQTEKTLRAPWIILIPVDVLLAAYVFFRWTQGKGNLSTALSPLGFIFIGASILINQRNPLLAKILLAVAVIIVVTGLILMFVY